MKLEQNEANEPTKSESEPEEQKSEELLNFENAMRRILSLTPEQAKDVIRRSPESDGEQDGKPEESS